MDSRTKYFCYMRTMALKLKRQIVKGWVMRRIFLAILAAAAASSVLAQDPRIVGKLAGVQGLVTVAGGDQLSNAVAGAPLVVGNRIITTSGGGATLVFNNGCEVVLKANESITVTETRNCEAILASVLPVGEIPGAGASFLAGGSSTNTWLVGGAVGLAAILSRQNDSKLSGS